ncbi:MAG: hypothetical protein OEY41_17770 [Acidimicrobiia bacterium]|nr:hypothetical protein [Acidimicrobiia bacterium]MDH5291847.1 hypothetical protein [Acidimicrobiia bacterium]
MGTPWISFFTPEEITEAALGAGCADVRCVPARELAQPYLAGRADGLRPASGEELLLARI